MRRHRAEACDRLALADVRPLVEPGVAAAALPDGTALALRWGTARGCYGGQPGRALLLAGEMPLVWRGTYQPFDNSQIVSAELRLASVKPMGQMIDLRGELTVGGVTTPVQGNLNAESDQLDLLMLCDCEVPGLEMGGVFTGLQGLQLSGWQAPRLTNPGGRLDLRPLSSSSRVETPSRGSAVRGLW